MKSQLVFLVQLCCFFSCSWCQAQQIVADQALRQLKDATLNNVKRYEQLSCSYRSVEQFVVAGKSVRTENCYVRDSETELWQSGSRTINTKAPAPENEGILCSSPTFSFHLLRAKGKQEYILQTSTATQGSELDDVRKRIRNDISLLYQPVQLGLLPLTTLFDRPHILIHRATEVTTASGLAGIRFDFNYDMTKSIKPELRTSTQKTTGWFVVLPSLGMVVDSYDLVYSGPVNRRYSGLATYKYHNSEPVLVSARRETYESDKLVHLIEISDVDLRHSVDTNEIFLLSHYQMPDFVGIELPSVPFYVKYRTMIVTLAIACVCLLMTAVLTLIIRRRIRSAGTNTLPPAGNPT